MKDDVNPMSPALQAAVAAPRCTARSKRSGLPCQAPAVTGWRVCRHHGAGGGHSAGPTHPSWRHGMRSREAVEMRRLVNEMGREMRETESLIA